MKTKTLIIVGLFLILHQLSKGQTLSLRLGGSLSQNLDFNAEQAFAGRSLSPAIQMEYKGWQLYYSNQNENYGYSNYNSSPSYTHYHKTHFRGKSHHLLVGYSHRWEKLQLAYRAGYAFWTAESGYRQTETSGRTYIENQAYDAYGLAINTELNYQILPYLSVYSLVGIEGYQLSAYYYSLGLFRFTLGLSLNLQYPKKD